MYKEVTYDELEILLEDLLWFKKEANRCLNKMISELRYDTADMILDSDIEYIWPYLIVGEIKLGIKRAEGFMEDPNSNSYKTFITEIIDPIRSRVGNLCCPLYDDIASGVHNSVAFNEECLESLKEYFLTDYKYSSLFNEYVQEYLHKVINDDIMRKKYSINNSVAILTIDYNESLKRQIIVDYIWTRQNSQT